MSDRHDKRDLKASIRELAAVLERGLDEHPTPAELQDFLAGDLTEEQRDRIEDHLALCRTCARAALDLADFLELEPVQRGDLLTESELAAQWKRFRATVAPPDAAAPRWPRKMLAWAAVLLLTVLGLTAWGVRESLKPPTEDDIYVAHLSPGPLRSSEKPLLLPTWANSVLLELILETLEHPEYRVEILTEAGRSIWSGTAPRQADGVAVKVPTRLLPAGAYRIRVYSPQEELVSEYAVEFVIDPASGN